jgi:methionyl-tRNA formyltransferase
VSLKVVFLGNDEWSVPPLEALARSSHDVVLVVTRTPRPGRRGSGDVPTPVAEAGGRLGLEVLETPTVKSGPGFEAIESASPDVLVVVAYGEILPKALLGIPSRGPVNLHFSLLPELRGAGPVQRAILEGMTATGVTTMLMDEGMDTGAILLQATERIEDTDDSGTLGSRLAAIGGRLLVDTLDRLEAGALEPTPQDHALATVAPKLKAADRVLDWIDSAVALARQVRALSPEPGATTTFRGKVLKVLEAGATQTDATARPGTVAQVTRDGLIVATGEGGFAPLEVAPEGRKRMSAGDFVRGFHVEEGERLGSPA